MYVIPGVGWVASILEGWTNKLNKYGLIYAGLTGEPFWVSAVLKKKKGSSSERKFCVVISLFLLHMKSDYFDLIAPLTLLTISLLTLTFPFALTAYLFVAHILVAPSLALVAAAQALSRHL